MESGALVILSAHRSFLFDQRSVTPPESDAAQEVVTVPTPQNDNDATSDVIPATPWISAPLNELSNELYDFIEVSNTACV